MNLKYDLSSSFKKKIMLLFKPSFYINYRLFNETNDKLHETKASTLTKKQNLVNQINYNHYI